MTDFGAAKLFSQGVEREREREEKERERREREREKRKREGRILDSDWLVNLWSASV